MADPNVQRIQDWLRAHEQELLEDTLTVLRIPSIESDPELGAPFGRANLEALEFVLERAKGWGMSTKNLEGYIGYADTSSDGPLIMSLGHLDVVPVGPGWKHEPFGAEIDEGYVYARGAVDDKGPSMAAFYAARAIMETVPDLKARLRIVFGCNEESGFHCVERYVQTEEPPVFGVAPDSGWPLYHAEKGIANLHVSVPMNTGSVRLLEAQGGQRPNIVIDSASARVAVDPSARKHVEEKLADAWDKNVSWEWDGDELLVRATGKAAHGSMPFLGDSAGTRLFRFLMEIAPLDSRLFFEELMESTHIGGVGVGIDGRDDVSQDLTCNLGVFGALDGKLQLLFNVRYPVTWKGEVVRDRCTAFLKTKASGFVLDQFDDSPSLYFPLEHPMVRIISDVVREETGETKPPGVMGGGTYARAVPNTVSIGTGWEGDGHAHETDERLKVEHLFRMSRIYAHILYRLALEAGG